MNISEFGGETELIKQISEDIALHSDALVLGIGDDCAVLHGDKNTYQLLTTDTLVENVHFTTEWLTAYQIGCKLVEVNVSDILAMGGTPAAAVIALTLPGTTDIVWVKEFYKGVQDSSSRHGIAIAGGDTTNGPAVVLTLTLLGTAPRQTLKLRSGAKEGDRICVTGALGKSAAGLAALKSNIPLKKNGYVRPTARVTAESSAISEYATAMIDISDGLGSEVAHICSGSNTGAFVDAAAIPVTEEVKALANTLRIDPLEWALYGGEDYELLFTIPDKHIKNLRKKFSDFYPDRENCCEDTRRPSHPGKRK